MTPEPRQEILTDAPRPNHSTGPKTPEGKSRCRLNAYRHGLTGQINVRTPDEQQAYDQHSNIILASLAPATDFERLLAQSIADDHWRLNRAQAIESGMFSISMQEPGANEIDDAFAQVRTWTQEARNLQLLTIFDQRIQRKVDKNTLQLKTLQTERKEAAREAMRQAKLLYQLAQAEGKPYQPEAFFTTTPEVRESVFSTVEIAADLSREKLLNDAKYYDRSGELPEEDSATKGPIANSHRPPAAFRLAKPPALA